MKVANWYVLINKGGENKISGFKYSLTSYICYKFGSGKFKVRTSKMEYLKHFIAKKLERENKSKDDE